MPSTNRDSTYAKPFLKIPEQICRFRGRGAHCSDDVYAHVLERYGF